MKDAGVSARLLAGTVLLAACLITGCGGAAKGERFTNRQGKPLSLSGEINRVISAAPSNTEILAALGLADKIIAVDSYSTDIPGLRRDIARIDFSHPDGEAIISMSPDIIIASEHNRTGGGEDPFRLINEAGVQVCYIPTSGGIDGIYQDIAFLAKLFNMEDRGEALINGMKEQIEDIAQKGRGIQDKQTVYFEISAAPHLVSFGRDTFLHEMIEIIGAENIFADKQRWISLSAEILLERNPDVIMTNVNYIDNPEEEIKKREGFENLKAVKNNRVYSIDTNASSRPSHRIVPALQQMAQAVYPEIYEQRR